MVDSIDRKVRFARLIEFLNTSQPLIPQIDALLHPDPCHQQNPEHCVPHTDFCNWVYCYFERIGKLIVLESGEGPRLPIQGEVFAGSQSIGMLHNDGTIRDKHGVLIGNVTVTRTVVGRDGKLFVDTFGDQLMIKDEAGKTIGFIRKQGGLQGLTEDSLGWLPARDTCDLDKVRLTHLDGSVLKVCEYDRMQRFIRLWHKLGWTIAETDLALIGTSSSPASVSMPSGVAMLPGNGNSVGFDIFQSDCSDVGDGDTGGCCDTPEHHDDGYCPDITGVPENKQSLKNS